MEKDERSSLSPRGSLPKGFTSTTKSKDQDIIKGFNESKPNPESKPLRKITILGLIGFVLLIIATSSGNVGVGYTLGGIGFVFLMLSFGWVIKLAIKDGPTSVTSSSEFGYKMWNDNTRAFMDRQRQQEQNNREWARRLGHFHGYGWKG